MWSAHALEVIDAVARTGSFSGAAEELHRVPSAISYTVKQIEEWLAVPLFERRHRDVVLTEAGVIFIKEGRSVIKKMTDTRHMCQQVANGWRGQFSIAVDCIVKPQRTEQLILDFYRHFPDIELFIHPEVFNGVWDALADGRVDVAIGATRASPIGERYSFRDMGFMSWRCVASPDHPLAQIENKLSDDQMRQYPSLCLEDTSRSLPKRDTWALDNQRRLVVPYWESGLTCLMNGLCVGMVPEHRAAPLCEQGKLVELKLSQPFPSSPCCLTWVENNPSPALSWLLDYLGDSETLNAEWLSS
ncbi:HTH-type transcriptional activator AllS [Providencia rustigianii]|uniref:LysR substrate binding domain protein n=2 Tax=Providencia rustigianii TaxID=158850 RepID=D1NY52_9GAMM|nr:MULTISPECIES: DNA-binding transcriptional activator PunR [Providencia]EFB73900.1 LysR substrate binding domain protein [Providencia rustigianii DSM 4541]MTC57246.1 LysR family transcriptional regulator [Providencia rustigianii]MTC60818.1 LysR family transcriptional regulator [Providencia rustigianii]SPY77365.1 HTH-type transcriptional activator AllS [Providencia rustigianii]SUC26743.1 HTH-type transcriptional activator AllS [Providencia rustigianii]